MKSPSESVTYADFLRYECAACGAGVGVPCAPLDGQKFETEETFHSARADAYSKDCVQRVNSRAPSSNEIEGERTWKPHRRSVSENGD